MKTRTPAVPASFAATLAIACGAGQPPPPPVASAAASPLPATPPPADPALAFRTQYRNPGGKWMPSQMGLAQHVDNFTRMGVHIDPRALSDPLESPLAGVVFLGGCTGSFVSPEGLVVTNHHCVQGALQFNSKDGKNYIESGLLAATRAEEAPAGPAARILIAQKYTDVSARMRQGLDRIEAPIARKLESEKRQKELVSSCEKDRPGIRCQVASFFSGDLYQLIEMLEIRDVRLV